MPLEKNIIRPADNKRYLLDVDINKIREDYFSKSATNNTEGVHTTLDQIVKLNLLTHPLTEYDIYAVCRNPLDRFLSFQNMIKNIENVNVVENFSIFKSYMNMYETRPQSTWLIYNNKLVNRVFLYENINLMISEIAQKYGITDTSNFSNYSLRQYEKYTNTISPRVLEYLKIYWQDDFKIYDMLKSTL